MLDNIIKAILEINLVKIIVLPLKMLIGLLLVSVFLRIILYMRNENGVDGELERLSKKDG